MRTRVALGSLTVLFCFIAFFIFFFIAPSEDALVHRGSNYDAPYFEGRKSKKYTGWSLADHDFTDDVDPRRARIVFYIMMAGQQDLAGLDVLLRNLYSLEHFFLIHLDEKAAAGVRSAVNLRVKRVMEERGKGLPNVRVVEPATPITWGGFTMTLNAVYGLTQALHWNAKWDYFINLSASDLPLLRTDEIAGILGEHKAANVSFIKGFKYQASWEGFKFVDRRAMFSEDAALMRDDGREKRWPWAILDADKEMLTRPAPELFTVYKGEFWVTLHRSMAEYVHKSPDNQARSLLAYFSGVMVSDEEFFQTVACNPHFPRDRMRTHNDNLRFVNWWGNQPSPAVVPPFRAVAAANSGAIFGRKFSSETPEGRDGIRWVEEYLAEPSKSGARVARVRRRLAASMTPEGEHVGFCGVAQVKNPAEENFAVDGDGEKLTPEFQKKPPRRGAWGERRALVSAGSSEEGSTVVARMGTDTGGPSQGHIPFEQPSRPFSDFDGRGNGAGSKDGDGEEEIEIARSSGGGRRRMQAGAAENRWHPSQSGVGGTEPFDEDRSFELTPSSASRRVRADPGEDGLRDSRVARTARLGEEPRRAAEGKAGRRLGKGR